MKGVCNRGWVQAAREGLVGTGCEEEVFFERPLDHQPKSHKKSEKKSKVFGALIFFLDLSDIYWWIDSPKVTHKMGAAL